jgi:ATP-dependent exoDNAse (exonuclease V) beta subunit
LVDEFQDTSHSQIRLLDKLTAGWSHGDGRTLFLVGDPMQSIYRFRKAEVSLFIQAFEGRLFPHIKLEPLQLRVNFRSDRPLVEWVNQVFPAVMPERSDPVMGAVSYSDSSTRPNVSNRGGVSIQIFPERDDAEEARQVVEYIGQRDENERIAILVRSRKHAADILAQLDSLKEQKKRFRYQAIEFNPLADTPLVQDLVSLTLALNQPADRLAWLATLRAPFCGLDLADLDALAGGKTDCIILDAVSTAWKDPSPQCGVSDAGLQRLRRIVPALTESVDRRGRESVRCLLESAWNRLGGPACARNDSELEDAASYFDLIDTLEEQGLPIDRDTLDQRMKNLHARPDALADGNLQVMTIYAAKGLQFDTVILPGLNRGTGNDTGKLLHWFELPGEDRIVMSLMRNSADKEKQKHSGDLIQFISSIEKHRQAFEDGRLLYVASTRAVRNLFLLAAIKPSVKDEIKPSAGTLLAELWPAIQAEQAAHIRAAAMRLEEALERESPTGSARREKEPFVPQLYRRLALDWRLPAPPDAVPVSEAEMIDANDYIEFRWAGEDARLTGNLVHRLLQLIAESGINAWLNSGGMSSRESWCRGQLASEGVTGGKATRIVRLTATAIENCLASERGRWILEPHEQSCCEYALTTMTGGQTRSMVLDRTFVDDGVRWIIDYKTSSHGGGNLEGFLNNEADRYRDQLQRYRQAVAINERLPISTALYFPLLDRFLEV